MGQCKQVEGGKGANGKHMRSTYRHRDTHIGTDRNPINTQSWKSYYKGKGPGRKKNVKTKGYETNQSKQTNKCFKIFIDSVLCELSTAGHKICS